MSTEAKCPFTHTAGGGPSNRDWWPNQLNLKILHQHWPRLRTRSRMLCGTGSPLSFYGRSHPNNQDGYDHFQRDLDAVNSDSARSAPRPGPRRTPRLGGWTRISWSRREPGWRVPAATTGCPASRR